MGVGKRDRPGRYHRRLADDIGDVSGETPDTARETRALLIPSARLRQPMPTCASTPPGGYWPAGATRKNKGKPGKNRPEPTKK